MYSPPPTRSPAGSNRRSRAELGRDIEVETHIEPLETRELGGHPADPDVAERIAASLARNAAQGGALGEIHNVRGASRRGRLLRHLPLPRRPRPHRRGDAQSRSTRWNARCARSFRRDPHRQPRRTGALKPLDVTKQARLHLDASLLAPNCAGAQSDYVRQITMWLDSPPWISTTTPLICEART